MQTGYYYRSEDGKVYGFRDPKRFPSGNAILIASPATPIDSISERDLGDIRACTLDRDPADPIDYEKVVADASAFVADTTLSALDPESKAAAEKNNAAAKDLVVAVAGPKDEVTVKTVPGGGDARRNNQEKAALKAAAANNKEAAKKTPKAPKPPKSEETPK